jgi:hypothetical protein
MGDDFAGGPLHNGSGSYHRLLGAGDVLLESFRAAPRFLLQRQQPHVDAQQRLRDLGLELAADRFAVVFLRRQNPVRQPAQTFLELERLIQALLVQHAPLFVGFLHGLAPRDPVFALADGGGEFLRTRSQSGFQPDKISLCAPGRTLMLLEGRIRFGKEYPGPPGVARRFRAGQRPRQREGGEGLFVNAGEVERLQAEGYRPAAQSEAWFQAGVTVSPQMFA